MPRRKSAPFLMVFAIARRRRLSAVVLLVGLLLSSCTRAAAPEPELIARGLNQPRGMAFDNGGNLYVAEAGALSGSENPRVSPPTNHSGRVLRIDAERVVTPVVTGLPYTHYPTSGAIGVTDVVFLGDVLYVLTGEGYDDQLSRSVLRSVPGAPPVPLASILDFAMDRTPLHRQQRDAGVPANPYAMAAGDAASALYVTDAASGRILRVSLDGEINMVGELPNMPPLTGVAFGPDEKLYVAMFSTLPHQAGSGAIWAADQSGELALAVDGLTTPIDLAFDAAGRLYVLEFGSGLRDDQRFAANSGRLLRIEPAGAPTVVLDRLNYPTALAFSQAGDLYIAVNGAFSAPGEGAILKAPCLFLASAAQCSSRSAD